MPVLFVGHGSPMNAVEDNQWSRGWRVLGEALPRPRAVLAVSAHWWVAGTLLTLDANPRTIHDFGGFPEALYAVRYPAPGDPELARRLAAMPEMTGAAVSLSWGLDHGTWSVLARLCPAADWPVVQLSIDRRLTPCGHLALGRALAPLRDEGVLILASGNAVHNLGDAFSRLERGNLETPGWASEYDAMIAGALERRDEQTLLRALLGERGARAHPSPEHYLPLLYALGAADERDEVSFPVTGFDLGSLSMRAVRFG